MDVSVVICTHDGGRWSQVEAALRSLERQRYPPTQTVVVVDHNHALFERARRDVRGALVVESSEQRGLGGARNSGIEASCGTVVAFLDDDAVASPDWLALLVACYADPDVAGVGGSVVPVWEAARPRWFPTEFDWVVGCTYRGMPEGAQEVRNLLGCNMSFRREVLDDLGRFRLGYGCDETELCIRLRQRWPERRLVYAPAAAVFHRVPADRGRLRYFLSRCYFEGGSKAVVSALVGADAGLSSERRYTRTTLPAGMRDGLADGVRRRDPAGPARAAAILAGLSITTLGYAAGRLSTSSAARRRGWSDAGGALVAPAAVRIVDLDEPVADLQLPRSRSGAPYRSLLAVARRRGDPIASAVVAVEPDGRVPRDRLALELGRRVDPLMDRNGRGSLAARARPVSVVVTTCRRPASLARCLRSILACDHDAFEVVVVENRPGSPATRRMLAEELGDDARLRYVEEPTRGLASARNAGLAVARGELVAFTDDDVIVDPAWIHRAAEAFERADDVACVTGLILPLELETDSQRLLEQFMSLGKGFSRRTYRLPEARATDPLLPYTPGVVGSGANTVLRADVASQLGGFDVRLGTGTPAVGGEDLDLYIRLLQTGHAVAYEPAAIVWHAHPDGPARLRRQVYRYGVGLAATLTKQLVVGPDRRALVGSVPSGIRYLRDPSSRKNAGKAAGYPRRLDWLERLGMAVGPAAFGASLLRTACRNLPRGARR